MDKWEIQHQFWSSFGIPAYPEDNVPDIKDITFPYITYQRVSGAFEAVLTVNASIYSRSTSYEEIDRITDEIEQYIRTMDFPKVNNGRLHVFIPDTMFAQSMDDPNDDQVKRNRLTVQMEFLTT